MPNIRFGLRSNICRLCRQNSQILWSLLSLDNIFSSIDFELGFATGEFTHGEERANEEGPTKWLAFFALFDELQITKRERRWRHVCSFAYAVCVVYSSTHFACFTRFSSIYQYRSLNEKWNHAQIASSLRNISVKNKIENHCLWQTQWGQTTLSFDWMWARNNERL